MFRMGDGKRDPSSGVVQNKNYARVYAVFYYYYYKSIGTDDFFCLPLETSIYRYTTSLITVTITVMYLTARPLTLGRPLRPHLSLLSKWWYNSTVPLQSCNASSTHRDELLRFQPNEYIWNQSANACTRTYKVARKTGLLESISHLEDYLAELVYGSPTVEELPVSHRLGILLTLSFDKSIP
jgi:hypothetical protein